MCGSSLSSISSPHDSEVLYCQPIVLEQLFGFSLNTPIKKGLKQIAACPAAVNGHFAPTWQKHLDTWTVLSPILNHP